MAKKGTSDTFSNPVAGLGWGTAAINEGTQYVLNTVLLSQQYSLLISLFSSHWLCRKIISVVPADMLKNWVSLEGQLQPDQVDQFERAVDNTGTLPKILEVLEWARLFGGAGAVIMLKGQGNKLAEPLDLDAVDLGDYRGLLVFDRWSGIQGSLEVISDLDNPDEFGLPVYYTCTTKNGTQFRVHHSRLMRFSGRKLPAWDGYRVQGWGLSELESVWDELKKRDNTAQAIAQLVHRANVMVETVPGLAEAIALGNQTRLNQIQEMIAAQVSVMNNQGILALPADNGEGASELVQHQYSFGGLNDIYQTFLVEMAGACEIPYSRLFGRTVSGLGQSNEGDEQIYYDMIAQKQRRELRPQLKKLIPIIAKSAWGDIPDDLDFRFKPMQEMNAKEKAELGKTVVDAVSMVFNAGLISQKSALEELRNSQGETGMWNSITDEMIEAADDEVQKPLEMGGVVGDDGDEAVPAK